MIKIEKNKLILNGKKICFENSVIEAAEYKGKVVIVFNTDEDDGYDNVFCYTYEKKLLWRISPAPIDIGGTVRSPYVGVDIRNGNCRVVDFFGRRFCVDIENGEIISKDIVK